MTTISVITPTIGRPSLQIMLSKLLPQMTDGDEVLVIGDGPQPEAKMIVSVFSDPAIKYSEAGPFWNYGNPQRNLAAQSAKGDYLMYIDDDDVPLEGALTAVRKAAAKDPGRPFMFKMNHPGMVLWLERVVRKANVSGQMFVIPNVKDRLGTWTNQYTADFDFINSTLARYPGGKKALVWKDEILVTQGFAGPRSTEDFIAIKKGKSP